MQYESASARAGGETSAPPRRGINNKLAQRDEESAGSDGGEKGASFQPSYKSNLQSTRELTERGARGTVVGALLITRGAVVATKMKAEKDARKLARSRLYTYPAPGVVIILLRGAGRLFNPRGSRGVNEGSKGAPQSARVKSEDWSGEFARAQSVGTRAFARLPPSLSIRLAGEVGA